MILLNTLAPLALAQDLTWEIASSGQSGTAWAELATCSDGKTPISGGAVIDQVGAPECALAGNVSATPDWTGSWTSVLGADPHPNDATVTASALCAAEPLLDCLQHVTLETDLEPTSLHDVTLACPPGTYLVGGGAELIGDSEGVVFRAAAPSGLLWPVGYRAIAELLDGPVYYDWGIRLEAWCGEPAVMGSLSVHDGAFSVSTVWSGAANPTAYDEVGVGSSTAVPAGCGAPITPGLAAWAPNAIAGMGWGADGAWTWRVHEFQRPADPAWSTAKSRAVCATDLATLEQDLQDCVPTPPPPGGQVDPFDLDVPAIGGTILFGVIDGSSGIIVLPGSGPIPVDPEWSLSYADAAAAIDVGVLPVDLRLRDAVLDEIKAALDAEGTAWSVSSEISRTPGTSGVTFVVPRSEQAAADWLRDHRADFEGHPGFVVLVLDQAGAALASMTRWR
jgi:hypothetical protein